MIPIVLDLIAILAFALHLLAMNAASAGPLASLLFDWRKRDRAESHAAACYLSGVSIVTFLAGMVLGLALAALVWNGETLRTILWSIALFLVLRTFLIQTFFITSGSMKDTMLIGDFLVVNKAAGMVVHPAPGHPDGTMVNALLHRVDRLSRIGGDTRPGIVHRLDKDTSGLLVVAKTDEAYRALRKALQRREVGRGYLAACWGHLDEEETTVDRPLGRVAVAPAARTGSPPTGQPEGGAGVDPGGHVDRVRPVVERAPLRDADARLVRVVLVAIEKADLVGRDDGHAGRRGELGLALHEQHQPAGDEDVAAGRGEGVDPRVAHEEEGEAADRPAIDAGGQPLAQLDEIGGDLGVAVELELLAGLRHHALADGRLLARRQHLVDGAADRGQLHVGASGPRRDGEREGKGSGGKRVPAQDGSGGSRAGPV